MSGPMLQVRGLRKAFGGVAAVDGADLEVRRGEILSLIGPNGSGKSTLLNCITGFLQPDGGRVEVDGVDVTGRRPDQVAMAGVGRTFQDVHTFPGLSVLATMLVFGQQHQGDRLWQRMLHTPSVRRREDEAAATAMDLLDVVGLRRMAEEPSGSLSYGQRKLLGFAAALMSDPPLVLLDEPAAAVNPTMIERMKAHLRAFNARGTTFVLVEHNMEMVMDLSDTVVVLDVGRVIAAGTPREVQHDVEVQEAYFGR